MEICGFGWQNRILDAVLSASSEVAALPASNLKGQQGAPSLAWRASGTSASLTIALSVTATWRVFSLHRTNLTSGARVTAAVTQNGSIVASWSSSAVSGGQSVVMGEGETYGNGARIDIDDPDNPDGYLSIPLAFAGDVWQPARNYSTESTETLTVGQDVANSLTGGEFVDARYVQRGLSIAHQSYGDADATVLRQIQRAAATGQNILFVPDPSASSDVLAETVIFGRLSGSDLSNPFGAADRHAQTMTMTERL